MMDWLAETYVNALNIIHYMHDKYCYERLEMALHDYRASAYDGLRHRRSVGCGRLPVGDQARQGQADPRRARPPVDFEIEGDYPGYGNNDDRADDIAVELVETFMAKSAGIRPTGMPSTRSRC